VRETLRGHGWIAPLNLPVIMYSRKLQEDTPSALLQQQQKFLELS